MVESIIILGVIFFAVTVVITRWLFKVNRIVKLGEEQVRLLKKLVKEPVK